MADSNPKKSIAERSADVRRILLDVLEKSKTIESPVEARKVEDVLDRFKLWAGNLGALHPAHKRVSLESRLADSPGVRDQICEHLDDMQEASQDLLSLLSERRSRLEFNAHDTPETSNTKEPEHDPTQHEEYTSKEEEADYILRMVSECLRALFRIGILVRKATPRDRFELALQRSEYAFSAQFDINYVRERYPKLASEDSDWLVSRLGFANSKRRQFINYARDHRAKLEVEDPTTVTNIVMDATTVRESSKATTFVVPRDLSTSDFLQSSLDTSIEDDLTSLVSASTAFDHEASLRLPSLADMGPDGEYFECPICFTLQSFRTEKAWKLHAYHDLKAYVCTSAGQTSGCEHKLFNDRDTWFDHELKHHYSLYVCNLCRCQYTTAISLGKHLTDEHGPYSNDEIESVIEHGKFVPSQLRAQDCPFCDTWASILSQRRDGIDFRAFSMGRSDIMVSLTHFKRHVATHLEQVAIFAIPRTMDNDDEQSHDAADANSEAFSYKDEQSQDKDAADIGDVLQFVDDDFKARITTTCDELLARSRSNPQSWKDDFPTIMSTVFNRIARRFDLQSRKFNPYILEDQYNMKEASAVLMSVCPSLATLSQKFFSVFPPGNNFGESLKFIARRWPVDIYEVSVDQGWVDQGNGFCRPFTVHSIEGEKGAHIKLQVVSRLTTERLIIQEPVDENSNFLLSGKKSIVWSTTQFHTRMALSFQDTGSRDAVWRIINNVQQNAKKQGMQPAIYEDIGDLDPAVPRAEQETQTAPSEFADLFRELAFGGMPHTRPTLAGASTKSIDRKFPCPHCQVITTQSKDLDRHIVATHKRRGASRPVCEFCRGTFSRGDNLKRHMRTCRKRPGNSPTSASSLGNRESPTQVEAKNEGSETKGTTVMAPE
ncbi:hypothetical protein KVR01_007993 [Diaporthe batatas]|uniref:uncharacterized protein n=1 Tax=Diaporthe batatas TaxID=748121 RepID=UPI001D04175E|nr:uncharacterized protein KVR01_007993 [Diaporthe batatas]KAG8162228.1 hypothetical protein KVR01_007993 [Diaporthe batatas]